MQYRVAFALAAALAPLAGALSAQVPLLDQPLLAVLADPAGLALLDVDGDGRDEIVVTEGASGVQLFRSTADGIWLPPGTIGTGGPAGPVAAGDLNGDGRPDLVVAGGSNGQLSVVLADGVGGFLAPAVQTLPGVASDVALGDLDRDGALDAVVLDGSSAAVRVLLGTGGGALVLDASYATKPSPTYVALGDSSGDGHLDVHTSHVSSIVARLLGDGAGGLGTLRSFASGGFFEALDGGDVDGDGRYDVIGTSFSPDAIIVLRGMATGLAAPQLTPLEEGGGGLAARDLDGDGFCDVVALEWNPPNEWVAVARADGKGGLDLPTRHLMAGSGDHVALGDVDGDGALDAVASELSWKLLTVLRGDGAGDLLDPPTAALGGSSQEVCTADFDGDGFPDFAAARTSNYAVITVASDGAGGLHAPVTTPLPVGPGDVQAGDMDGDGDPDVVALIGYDGTDLTFSTILLRNAAGSLTAEPAIELVASLQYANQLALADLDGDGALDLVGSFGSFLQGGGVLKALGDGTGGWILPAATHGTSFFAQVDVAVADLDLDGDLDASSLSLDTATLLSYGMRSWGNDGAGNLSSKPGTFVSGTGSEIPPWGLTFGDLDEDGDADAVAHTDKAYVFTGSGTYTMTAAGSLTTPNKPSSATFGDFDADGRADILMAVDDPNSMSLFLGTGTGFAAPSHWLAAHGVGETVAVDANGDGLLDVAAVGRYEGSLVLHLNGLQAALAAVTPSAGDLVGGQVVTLSLQPPGTELPAPQVSFGGVPAQVLASGPGYVQVLAPGIAEPPGAAVDVTVSGAFGSLQRAAAWTWTPSLTAGVSGSAASGGSLHVAWQGDPAAGAQLVTLWLGHPLVPPVSLSFGAWAGILRVPPFLFLLAGAPAGLSPLDLGFPPLDPAIVGVPLSLQAALTGEGGAKGAFSNLAVFEIP